MNTGNNKFLQILDRICFVGSILFLSALAAWSIAGRFTALQLPSFLQEWLFPVSICQFPHSMRGSLVSCVSLHLRSIYSI